MKRLSPSASVRKFCVECVGNQYKQVRDCTAINCFFYNYRMKDGGLVLLKTIRNYCLHCHGWPIKEGNLDPEYKDGGQGFAWKEAKSCTDKSCFLFAFRPGTVPYAGRGGNAKALLDFKREKEEK